MVGTRGQDGTSASPVTTSWPEHFSAEVVKQGFGGTRLSSYTIALEAWRRGLAVTFYDPTLTRYTVSDGTNTMFMNASRPDSLTRPKDYRKLRRKWSTKRLLAREGIPVPRGVLINVEDTKLEDLRAHADRVGYPLVIKPSTGSVGKGVLTGIDTWVGLREGYRHLVEDLGARKILMEQHFEGDDYRILVIGDRVVAACRRIPANVRGDGVSTVSELISSKNASRRQNPFLSKGTIRIDYEVEQCLDALGLALSDIPRKGSYVQLRRVANASAGGDVIDATTELPSEILAAAVRAVKAVPNIVIAGVDVLYQTGQAASPETYTIIEMNQRPQIGVNMYPTHGIGRDVPKAYLDYLFPHSERSPRTGDETLAFDVNLISLPLRAGTAASVELAPLPTMGYPVRRLITYTESGQPARLTTNQGTRIQRIAREENAIGRLDRTDTRLQLLVGASNEAAVDRVRKSCEKALGAKLSSTAEESTWGKSLVGGFHVSADLMR